MVATRVIPCLLLKNHGLVKTVKFKDPKYLGDPINAGFFYLLQEVDGAPRTTYLGPSRGGVSADGLDPPADLGCARVEVVSSEPF